jgi:hypothetical protein
MGHYEDFWYEITESIEKHGIRKEFDKQLEKMRGQEKHKYTETMARWEYAFQKVLKQKKEKGYENKHLDKKRRSSKRKNK